MKLERYEEALWCFNDLIARSPTSTAFVNKGVVLKNMGEHDDAVAYFDRALKINPCDNYALANKANVLSLQKKYDQALECLDAALKMSPQDAIALYNRGEVLISMGKASEGKECQRKAMAMSPALYAEVERRKPLTQKMSEFFLRAFGQGDF